MKNILSLFAANSPVLHSLIMKTTAENQYTYRELYAILTKIEKIIEKEPDALVEKDENNNTALHIAAEQKQFYILGLLIHLLKKYENKIKLTKKKEADKEITEKWENNQSVASLEETSGLKDILNCSNKNGNTVLGIMFSYKLAEHAKHPNWQEQQAVIFHLLDEGAKLNIEKEIDILADWTKDADLKEVTFMTLYNQISEIQAKSPITKEAVLFKAIDNYWIKLAKKIISDDRSILQKILQGRTPLHAAIANLASSEQDNYIIFVAILNELYELKVKERINIFCVSSGENKDTPLEYLIRIDTDLKYLEYIILMIDAGAKLDLEKLLKLIEKRINKLDFSQRTHYFQSIFREILLIQSCDFEKTLLDVQRVSATFSGEARYALEQILKELEQYIVHRKSPLQLLIQRGNLFGVRTLLEQNKRVFPEADIDGNTFWHLAASYKDSSLSLLTNFLKDSGENCDFLTFKNKEKLTPLDILLERILYASRLITAVTNLKKSIVVALSKYGELIIQTNGDQEKLVDLALQKYEKNKDLFDEQLSYRLKKLLEYNPELKIEKDVYNLRNLKNLILKLFYHGGKVTVTADLLKKLQCLASSDSFYNELIKIIYCFQFEEVEDFVKDFGVERLEVQKLLKVDQKEKKLEKQKKSEMQSSLVILMYLIEKYENLKTASNRAIVFWLVRIQFASANAIKIAIKNNSDSFGIFLHYIATRQKYDLFLSLIDVMTKAGINTKPYLTKPISYQIDVIEDVSSGKEKKKEKKIDIEKSFLQNFLDFCTITELTAKEDVQAITNVVNVCLQHGAKVNLDRSGVICLGKKLQQGLEEVVNLIISYQMDDLKIIDHGKTVLDLALEIENVEVQSKVERSTSNNELFNEIKFVEQASEVGKKLSEVLRVYYAKTMKEVKELIEDIIYRKNIVFQAEKNNKSLVLIEETFDKYLKENKLTIDTILNNLIHYVKVIQISDNAAERQVEKELPFQDSLPTRMQSFNETFVKLMRVMGNSAKNSNEVAQLDNDGKQENVDVEPSVTQNFTPVEQPLSEEENPDQAAYNALSSH